MANATKHFDIVLIGSSLLAGLIAGLLARERKTRVCLIVDPAIKHRLARETGLSVDCITRPETWKLLSNTIVESSKLLTSIGGGRAIGRVNPLFVCNTNEGADALAHMYHVARGTGYEIERLGLPQLPDVKAALRFRGAKVIERKLFWSALVRWLEAGSVELLEDAGVTVSFKREGQATIRTKGGFLEADRVVLADEAAIMSVARPRSLERHFELNWATTLLTEPNPELSERIIVNPENRFCAHELSSGAFEISAHVALDDMATRIKMNVPSGEKLRRAGQSVYNMLNTNDGAPLVGNFGRSGAWAVAGFGHFGVFLAPSIARILAGKPSDFEREYFARRGAGSARKSQVISEFRSTRTGRQNWQFQK